MRVSAGDGVKLALNQIGVDDIVVSEVRQFRRNNGHKEFYRGAEYHKDYDTAIKIELVVTDRLVEQAIRAIRGAAQVGKISPRAVFVLDESDGIVCLDAAEAVGAPALRLAS